MNYSINICSELPVQFSPGHVYLVRSKDEFVKKESLFSNEACFINYSFEGAIRAIPFFDQMKEADQNRILDHMENTYGFKVMTDDLFGKMMVSIFYHLESYDLVIVALTGLGNNSIDTYIEWLQQVVVKEKNKLVILTSSLKESGRIAVTMY